MGKYEDLVYTLPVEHHSWAHYVSPRCGFSGTAEDPRATINYGFSVTYDENVMEEPHMHDAKEEYLIFTGADLGQFFSSFDAEVEVWMGDDPRHMEKLTITQPSVIRVPPKVWHCPINFRRVGKPVCFVPLYLDGGWCKITRQEENGRERYNVDGEGLRHCVYDSERLCTYCGKCFSAQGSREPITPEQFLAPYRQMEQAPRSGKFDSLVYAFRPEERGFSLPGTGLSGGRDLPDACVHIGYDLLHRPGELGQCHFHPAVHQYLMFTGADLMDPFASFDGEITVRLGDDPDRLEEYRFHAPTLVHLPPELWHGPITVHCAQKPISLFSVYTHGRFAEITRQTVGADGQTALVYQPKESGAL